MFQLGGDQQGLSDRLYNDSKFLLNTLKGSEELVSFLKSPVVKPSVKKSFLKETFNSFLHESSLRFLYLIIDNNREPLLNNILLDFIDLYRSDKGVKSVTLITAIAVDEPFKNNICSIIEERLKGSIDLECKVNEDLLGGLVIIVDGKQADGSVAGKLRAIKKKMLIK